MMANFDRDFRARLEQMVSEPTVEDHPAQLEALRREFHHTVVIVESSAPITKYNCVMHALDLIGRIDHDCPAMAVPTAFAVWLINKGYLVNVDQRPGALVVWSAHGMLKHIGKITAADRAGSKWGVTGLLFAHGLNEVPERYGNVSGYYEPIGADLALAHLDSFYSCEVLAGATGPQDPSRTAEAR
jgi:hypothetical protein